MEEHGLKLFDPYCLSITKKYTATTSSCFSSNPVVGVWNSKSGCGEFDLKTPNFGRKKKKKKSNGGVETEFVI